MITSNIEHLNLFRTELKKKSWSKKCLAISYGTNNIEFNRILLSYSSYT